MRKTLQLCWVETLGQILAGQVFETSSHPLRFIYPEVLQLVVRPINTVVPTNYVSVFRVGLPVSIKPKINVENYTSRTHTATYCWTWRIDVEVRGANRPNLCVTQRLGAAN